MNEIGKKYPRIYSISTVGIRNHNNADYLIHPLRTDFTGGSSTGKSLVGADLPQLILTAGKFYKSATPPKGGVPREYNTIPLPKFNFAYSFMNLEVAEQKFITVGVQIRNNRKLLIPFIIQGEKYLGYENKQSPSFKPLEKIIRYKDFLINENEMPTIENLKDHLDEQGFYLTSFYHKEDIYHRLLFENQILHLDLSKDEKLQKQFANTLQSLSRGDDIDTSGNKFKKFLFHYDNQIEDKFKKEATEIEQSHRDFQSNSEKHLTFTDKKDNLKQLLLLKEAKEIAFEARVKSETAFRFQKVREQETRLEEVRKLFFQTELEVIAIKEKQTLLEIASLESDENIKRAELKGQEKEFNSANSSLEDYVKELQGLNEILPTLEKENNLLKAQHEKVQQVEDWLKVYSTVQSLNEKFAAQSELNTSKQKLTELNLFLKTSKLLKEFEESEYSKSIHDATEFYFQKKNELNTQIQNIEKLIEIIDQQEPDTLAGWAVSNKIKLDELQESVLFHFATTATKFIDKNEFIPDPKLFIQSLLKAEEFEKEFILNLSGLHYHIPKRENYIFSKPDELQKEIKRIGKNYQKEIDDLKSKLKEIESLQQSLQNFGYSEEHLAAYIDRINVQSFVSDESFLKFTPSLFQEAIKLYEDDLKKKEEQKVKTLFAEKNKVYTDKLGKKINSEQKKTEFSTKKALAETQVNEITIKIGEVVAKITSLKTIDITDIETQFTTWKLNNENPFQENQDGLFKKYRTSYKQIKETKELGKPLLDLTKKVGEYENEIKGINKFIPVLQAAFETQEKQYLSHFKKPFDKEELIPNISESELKNLQQTETDATQHYKSKYEGIVDHFPMDLKENPKMRNHEYNFTQLILELIPPQLITNKEKPEDSLLNDIENILSELKLKIQVLNEEEARKIHSTIHSLKDIVDKHINDLERIQTHLKEFKLANHHKVSLEWKLSEDYDLKWIKRFKDDSQNARFMESFGHKTNASAHDILERIFKEYCPLVKEPKAHQILDPFNYYSAEAKIIDTLGNPSAASGGTGYGLLALLGIAKLSVVEGKKKITDTKPGIRILPIDEVAGLGDNFEMLYQLAQLLDYQIFTMTVSSNDLAFQDGKQIYYEFIGSANPDNPDINEGVQATFSKYNTIYDIEKHFVDSIFTLPDTVNNVV